MAVVGLVAGVALARFAGAIDPMARPARSFDGFGSRGVVFAARVVFVFTIAVAAGALIGRSLPALLVTIIVAAIGHLRWLVGPREWLATEAVLGRTSRAQVGAARSTSTSAPGPVWQRATWDEAYAMIRRGTAGLAAGRLDVHEPRRAPGGRSGRDRAGGASRCGVPTLVFLAHRGRGGRSGVPAESGASAPRPVRPTTSLPSRR